MRQPLARSRVESGAREDVFQYLETEERPLERHPDFALYPRGVRRRSGNSTRSLRARRRSFSQMPPASLSSVSPALLVQSAQFSTFRPGIWSKCLRLRVTTVARWVKAMPAMPVE